MRGCAARAGVIWRPGHSTRTTSDVLCGTVVANSTAGWAAGGAGLVATGSRTTASAVAHITSKITAATIARTWRVAADKKAAARLRKGRGARAGGQTHQSLLQFETIDLQMGPAKAKTPSWTAGLK